jgi:hypothetical protein
VRLLDRIAAADDDPIPEPLEASVLQGLRRALAIALAMAETYAEATGLAELKRANLEGRLPPARSAEFGELLAAEALVALHVFANATAFLLAPHMTEAAAEVGAVDEVLTDNAPLALHGALWELDQILAAMDGAPGRLVAIVTAYAEQLMEKAARRADSAPRLGPFTGASWHVEADKLTLQGFTPARAGKGPALAMAFKKPEEVIGNHIAKYQALRLAKMLMAYDFDRRLNPFAESAASSSPSWATARRAPARRR